MSRRPDTAVKKTFSMSPSTLAHLLLFGVVLVWGATFAVVKDALNDASPLVFNLLRMSLAFAALVAVNYRQLKKINRETVLAGAVAGLFLAAGYQFQTAGLALTTPTKSAFITGLVVVFIPLLTAIPALRPPTAHRPRWNTAGGALIAFTGLFLLTTPVGTGWKNLFEHIGIGDGLSLLCALGFAGHLLSLGHFSPRVPISQLATLQVGFAALAMAVTLPLGGRPYLAITARLAIALGITSLIATAAAFTIQSWAQQHLPPTHTALLLTLEPVFACATSVIFLGERLSGRSLAGAGLILAAIAITELIPAPAVPPSPI